MSDYRIIWLGDSLSLSVTTDGLVAAPYEGLAQWWSIKQYQSVLAERRRQCWQPMNDHDGTVANPHWAGAAFGLVKRLRDLGHTCHGMQISQGATILGVDWISPGALYARALAEVPKALASSRAPASPGSANTIIAISLTTNDCLSTDRATLTVQATIRDNLAALVAAVRALTGVGSSAKVVVRLASTALPAPATGTAITNARAGVALFIAADSGKAASYDPSAQATIGDGIHDTDAAALIVGAGMADAVLAL